VRCGEAPSKPRILPAFMQRDSALERLRHSTETFDIVVIGGGASGLGAAVEAATRGYRVALIEQSDFAKGTSSRSTKLVHGGVRYLKQGNVALVLSALRERGYLHRNAPHLVHDLSFVIPSYTWWEVPYYATGMALYDRLAGRESFGRSQRLSRTATLEQLATIEPAGLTGGVLYHDGQFDDARLAINLAQTAADHGATLVNYCACVALRKEAGRVTGIEARDLESGTEFTIQASAVINATGVFVDAVRALDDPTAPPIVTVSQGTHVVLPRRFLPGSSALMVPRTADGRVLFAIPWRGAVVVGTTDTPVPDASSEPRAFAAECEFLLEHARKYLAIDPQEEDVLSVFAGLRPLVKPVRARNTAKLSRDHTIVASASQLITLTGGKWTTYRKMGEDAVDFAENIAGFEHRSSSTTTLSIHGSSREGSAVPHLTSYGSDAAAILELAGTSPTLGAAVHPAFELLAAEVIWHARHEMARTVEDVLARRSRALILDARASIEAAPEVARLLAGELGRDQNWITDQVRIYTELARGYVLTDPASRTRPSAETTAR